jgi:hypothetical protein
MRMIHTQVTFDDLPVLNPQNKKENEEKIRGFCEDHHLQTDKVIENWKQETAYNYKPHSLRHPAVM